MAHPAAAQGFRERLDRVMARTGLNQAAFARLLGIDRSTLSQLLSAQNDRLPRAETLVAIAGGCRVSVDWLLGLSQREEVGAEIVQSLLTIEPQAHAPFDDRFLRWHSEAQGRKLRTVPVSFPDFMKSDAVLRFEYRLATDEVDPEVYSERRRRVAGALEEGNEIEACVSIQALDLFARGQGIWHGLAGKERYAQLERMVAFVTDHYPTLRLHLYDLRKIWSAPFSVFGQERAVVFLGPSWLVFNASEHIRLQSRRFDEIVRAAEVQPHAMPEHLRALLATAAASR